MYGFSAHSARGLEEARYYYPFETQTQLSIFVSIAHFHLLYLAYQITWFHKLILILLFGMNEVGCKTTNHIIMPLKYDRQIMSTIWILAQNSMGGCIFQNITPRQKDMNDG